MVLQGYPATRGDGVQRLEGKGHAFVGAVRCGACVCRCDEAFARQGEGTAWLACKLAGVLIWEFGVITLSKVRSAPKSGRTPFLLFDTDPPKPRILSLPMTALST